MSIKYHDNNGTKKYETDSAGALADNWDPSIEYPNNEYISVYFRTNCPAYRSGAAWMQFDNEDERTAFYNEVAEALIPLGWSFNELAPGVYGTDGTNGQAHIYIPPDSVSGSVLKNDIEAMAQALSNRKTFSLSWVDLYETVYDYTDNQYKSYLESCIEDIKGYVLRHAKTKRRNLFIRRGSLAMDAGLSVRRKRIGTTDSGVYHGDRMETKVVSSAIDSLIDAGYLIAHNHNGDQYIRTINKTEQRQKKLYIEEVA